MFNKIRDFFRKLGYIFAFGMKGGDDAIGTQDQNDTVVGVVQQQQAKSLGEALLKGEVTKEVEELRYRDYRVAKESYGYKYIGGGMAVKKHKPTKNLKRFKFKQGNSIICSSVYDELQRVGAYANSDRYIFEFTYADVPTIRLEAYASFGEFEIDDNKINVALYFDKYIKTNEDPVSKILLRRLGEITKYTDGHQIENDDICSNAMIMSFTTSNAVNEDDYIRYDIFGLTYESCRELSDAFVLIFSSSNFKRIDLTEKYYSKELDEKYKENAPKTRDIALVSDERKFYCADCGKEINGYDADITKYTFGRPLCQDCIKVNGLY